MTTQLIILCIPLALLPIVALGLRPLFDVFLREGAQMFGHFPLRKRISVVTSRPLAWINASVFAATWVATFGCHFIGLPHLVWTWLPAAGLVAALVLSIRVVEDRVGIAGHRAWLIGLLAFAGGNLPFFLIVPAALAVA